MAHKRIILFLFLFLNAFCQIASSEELTMKHSIEIPKEYSSGREQEAFEGTSDIERYINAYERTWWAVMNRFAKDIKWHPRHDEFICSGTPAASQGCMDGYEAAVKKVKEFLKGHTPKEVETYIKANIIQQGITN